MARKRVVSRTAFEYVVNVVVANMETMTFDKTSYYFVSVPELDEKGVLEKVKSKFGETVKIENYTSNEILLSMDENIFISLAEKQDARKKYNTDDTEE